MEDQNFEITINLRGIRNLNEEVLADAIQRGIASHLSEEVRDVIDIEINGVECEVLI